MEMSETADKKEPVYNTNSEDAEVRIAARRRRIQDRFEEKKREALEEMDSDEPEVKEEDMSKSCKQVEDSYQRLIKLKRDGTALVTNIQVAEDLREMKRRAADKEAQRQRRTKLESEAAISHDKFEYITKKWLSAKARKIPQDLYDLLISQQKQCTELIQDKNKLINELQQELKLKDDHYVKDLRKASEDIELLAERMEEQMKTISKAYREEIIQIEKAFQMERHGLQRNNFWDWKGAMQTRRDKEIDYLMTRLEKVEEYEEQLQEFRVQDAEEYNMIKIKLENDVEMLEQQLQQMRATFQLNQEKLEYNYQVLKKRDEENMITKSQQKRRITRQQDTLNRLKSKLAKQEKMYQEENQTLTDGYNRVVEQYKDIQSKIRHFAAVDAKNFEDVWLMNEGEVKELVQKALEADRIIHEQQLGLCWKKPNLCFMTNVGPIIPCSKQGKLAVQLAEEIILGGDTETLAADEEVQETPVLPATNKTFFNECFTTGEGKKRCEGKAEEVSLKTVKQLLDVLCDESGFLIERKLSQIITPLQRDERSLIRLDAIFVALGIESADDIFKLTDFFIDYKQHSTSELYKETDELLEKLEKEEAKKTESSTKSDKVATETEEHSEVCRRSVDEEADICLSMRSKNSYDLFHPNDILRALKDFLRERETPIEKQPPKVIHVKERDDSEDSEYWNVMANVISESHLKTWDALERALGKYYKVLVKREAFVKETSGLSQQNSEFRLLLQQYIHSRVNSELEIPPTQLFHLDLNQTSAS
uniref:Dynein regulatory complex protein 1 n=1 Tax=Callorhinchus milii TaxID=7868 RepID=V9KF21_CALMI